MAQNEVVSYSRTWEDHWRSRLPSDFSAKDLESDTLHRFLLDGARRTGPVVLRSLLAVLLEVHGNGCPLNELCKLNDDDILLTLGVGSLGYEE